MAQELKDIWYASEKRAKSSLKLFVYDDQGTLEIEPGQVNFIGRNQAFRIHGVQRISLVRQTWNWKMYLLVNILLLPVYFLLFWFLNPIVEVKAGTIIFAVVAVNLLGLLIGFLTRWVEVEHRNSNGSFSSSYFADGSRKGWSGIFGGTRKLYKVLRDSLRL